jgi:FtsZ-binding cell division protein ZapB
MLVDKRLRAALVIGSITSVVIVVVVYSMYLQMLKDESARLAQVKQQGILYDKHKQQCRDVATDLSVRIQELKRREKDPSLLGGFQNEVQAQHNALVAEASQLLEQCPHWIIEDVDKQIASFASSPH